MPITMGVKVEGLNTLHAKMAAWPALQKKHTKQGLGKVGQQMVRNWKKELRGPTSAKHLGVRSGTLRRSITARFKPGADVAVEVGTKMPYASIHEFGFDGIVQVRAHTRANKRGVFTVRDHSRHMKMPKRPHMRPAIRATQKKMPSILRNQYRAFLRDVNKVKRPD